MVTFRDIKEQLLSDTLVEKIWIILIELYTLVLAELGVNWENFIEKLIKNQKELNHQIKSTLSVLFSLNKSVA